MVLSAPHAPPRGLGAAATVETGPPATGMVFSFPSEKNPIDRPSGDQNGNVPPSVPASFRGALVSRGWIQIELRSFALCAQYATWVPSAERTGGPEKSPVKSKEVSKGGSSEEWMIGVEGVGRSPNQRTMPRSAAARTAHAKRSRMRRPIGGTAVGELI
jgi:hypothetical protein